MFPRDWILETLAGLAVWYWPIFLLEMLRMERYCARRRAAGKIEMIGIGVTRKGRIHIISRMKADTPGPADWTLHAPRAPWAKLDLARLAGAFAPTLELDWIWTLPAPHPRPPVSAVDPLYLDPG